MVGQTFLSAGRILMLMPQPNLPPPEFDLPLGACPLCEFPSPRPYDKDFRGIAISCCLRCGVKFMNPQYTDAYLSAFYARYITPEHPFGPGPEYAAMERQRRVDNFTKIEQRVPAGRLLAIGCGDGLELRIARQRGWAVEGYDVDPATTEKLSRELNVPIYSGELCRLGLPDEGYDCVYLDQVLEHPKQPGQCLRVVHRLLRPGGALFIGCPNIRSLSSATKHLLEQLGFHRHHRGRYYDTQHHLFYYSPGVLRGILEQYHGFQVHWIHGDPLIRKKRRPSGLALALCQRLPWLDSTFQLLATKPSD
jgi:SAM-dependent methyltransferase